MTYCIGINVNEGMIFASDSRTNAGLDNVNTYSKMLNYAVGDRNIVIVTSGNLATSQAVYSSVKKDLESKNPQTSLNTCENITSTVTYFALTYGIPRIGFGGLDIGKWIFNPADSIRNAMATGDAALVGGGNSLLDDIMENS